MQEREERLFTTKSFQVYLNGQARLIQASNLSSTGACLAGLRQLPVGAIVTFHHGSLRIAATVVWSNDKLTGVKFNNELSPSDLLELQFG